MKGISLAQDAQLRAESGRAHEKRNCVRQHVRTDTTQCIDTDRHMRACIARGEAHRHAERDLHARHEQLVEENELPVGQCTN